MKTATINHIKKSLSTLIPVVNHYATLYPGFTIITTISVVLSNACTKSGTNEEITDLLNLTKDWVLALKSHNPNDYFISYIADEVYMIVHGNDMAEYQEEYEEFLKKQEVCSECGEYMIHHIDGKCP